MRVFALSLSALLVCPALSFSAVTGINSTYTDNFNATVPLSNSLGLPLPNGSSLDGDGAIIQFGVFDPSIVPAGLDPAFYTAVEWAAFIPLTGEGSSNPHFNTTMGDGLGPAPDGFYDIGVTFDTTPATGPASTGLPGANARVGIRYFDGTSLASATAWNTVTSSHGDWVMAPPASPFAVSANASVDARAPSAPTDPSPGLVWEGGASSAFQTTIPEPGGVMLGLLGTLLLLRRRR